MSRHPRNLCIFRLGVARAGSKALGNPECIYLSRRYFGAAKQLPGVRELFEREPPRQIRRTRHQMYAHINADYYGFRDEEDGVLERVEAAAEREIRDRVRPRCSSDI